MSTNHRQIDMDIDHNNSEAAERIPLRSTAEHPTNDDGACTPKEGAAAALYGDGEVGDESHLLTRSVADGSGSSSKLKDCLSKYNPLPHGGLASSGFNLASATLGAGTLAIPFAMANSGGVLGTIILLICMAATVYSIRVLIIVYEHTGCTTFEMMAERLVSKYFKHFTAFIIVAFCWGVTLVYIVAIGSILKPLQTYDWMPQGEWGLHGMVAIFWFVFMLPLSLLKEINSLRYASLIGMLSTAVLVSAIIAHGALTDGSISNIVPVAPFSLNMIQSIPTFTFAFCCQTNAFEIYTEMKRASANRMTLASGVSMLVCTCIYIIAGLAGMANFGTSVEGNILQMYKHPTEHAYLMVAFIGIAITVTMAFPICILPTRDSILQVIGYEDAYHTPAKVRIPLCVALSTASLILGILVPNMQVLFGVLGGVCGSSIAYVFPAIFAYKSGVWTRETVGLVNQIFVGLLFVGGLFFGALGTAVAIYQTIVPSSSNDSPSTSAPSSPNATHMNGTLSPGTMAPREVWIAAEMLQQAARNAMGV